MGGEPRVAEMADWLRLAASGIPDITVSVELTQPASGPKSLSVACSYVYAALGAWVPLGTAALCAILPRRLTSTLSRIAVGVCAVLLAVLGRALLKDPGSYIELTYPGTDAVCLRMDPFAWIICAATVVALGLALVWGPGRGEDAAARAPVHGWLWIAAFLALCAAAATTITEAAAVVVAVGSLPVIYRVLRLPHAPRPVEALWPVLASGLALGALIVGAQRATTDPEGALAFADLLHIHEGTREGLTLFMGAAYLASGMFPFCVWPYRTGLSSGARNAAFLLGSAAFAPGAVILARMAYMSRGPVQLIPQEANPAPVFLLLTCLTAAYLLVEFYDLRRVPDRMGVVAGMHSVYLLAAALLCTVSVGLALQAVLFFICARALAFPLIFLALDWLSGDLRDQPGLRGLPAAAQRHPIAALAFLAGVAAVAGLPPFAGFWAKALLVQATLGPLKTYGYALLSLYALELIVLFTFVLRPWNAQEEYAAPAAEEPGEPPALKLALLVLLVFANIAVPCVLVRVMSHVLS